MNKLVQISLAILLLSLLPAGVFAQSESINTVAGNGIYGYTPGNGIATAMKLANPRGVSVDSLGNFYFADMLNHRICKVMPDGTYVTVAGKGDEGSSGDGGPATSAYLSRPNSTAVDVLGNLYIAEKDSHRIRKVNSAGVISTFAGTTIAGFSGDGGNANAAKLNFPQGIVVDRQGNLYIADSANNRIRKVTVAGKISTVAGNGNAGYSGDGGLAILASLNNPQGVSVDSQGNILIADCSNHSIRVVNPDGIISTIAGTGTYGFSGDDGVATEAQLDSPQSVEKDAAGNIYITDNGNNRIRKINMNGIITTLIGADIVGFKGDGGLVSAAQIYSPLDAKIDENGALYFADSGNMRIRKIEAVGSDTSYFPQIVIGGGIITYITIANTGSESSSASVTLSDSTGSSLPVDAVITNAAGTTSLQETSSIPVTVPAGGVAFVTVTLPDPEGEVQAGWAKLVWDGGILTSVATYDLAQADGSNQIVGVPQSSRLRFATIPVDNISSLEQQTAYAIVNPSGMTIHVKVALVEMNGTVDSSTILDLGPGHYQSEYFFELLNCSNFRGSVVLIGQNNATFAVMALREKYHLFTSMPITSGKSSVVPE